MTTAIPSQLLAPDPAPLSERGDGLEAAVNSVWRIVGRRGAAGLALYTVGPGGDLYRQAVRGSVELPPRISLPSPATPPSPLRRLYRYPPLPDAPHLPQALWLPLADGPRLVGWLVVSVGAAAALRRRASLRLLRLAADGVAFALHAAGLRAELATAREQAQLYEAEHRHVRLWELANRMASLTAGALDIDALLSTAVRSLHDDLGYLSAAVLLYDPPRQELELRSTRGPDELRAPLGTRYPVTGGLSGEAMASGETVVSHDSWQDPRVRPVTPVLPRSIVSAPLRGGDCRLGVLSVASDRVNGFEPADVAVIQTIADQLGGALTSARLYTETLRAKQRAETLLREAQAGLVVLDERWRVEALNPAAAAIFQQPAEAVAGRALAALIGQAPAEDLTRLAEAEEPSSGRRMTEAHLPAQQRDVLMGVARLHPGFLVSLLDVTALKEVDRLKSEIVANFSHELRAPLASIKAYTELLLHYHQTDGELPQQFLTIVNEETDRLTDLVNEVLDLSRLEAGHLEMEYSRVSLLSVVEEVVRLLEVQALARDILIEVRAATALPPVWGDRQLLSLLVRNLMSNAVKYNRPGGSVWLLLNPWTGDDGQVYVRLQVRDAGVGIPALALPHIFDKFFRVRSTTESGIQGTGLGLTLAKAAVEAHRGKISVSSVEGVGSEFTVLIPSAVSETPRH